MKAPTVDLKASSRTRGGMLPDMCVVETCLRSALATESGFLPELKVLKRKLPPLMSTFPNEIITCKLPGGQRRRLFVKYDGGRKHDAFGHRGGIAYEAEVYRHLLGQLPGFRPKYFGGQADRETGEACIVLEYIPGSIRVSDLTYKRTVRQPKAMAKAARWLGEFHSTQESRVSEASLSFLKSYDRDYYRGWAKRAFTFAGPLLDRFPWLREAEQSGDAWFAPLLQFSATVIHGEFYAKTLLLRRDDLFILDWESAAIAAGEIDLAALTEGMHWPRTLVQQCERAYVKTRWPKGPPASFASALNAAKIYLHFRWLGERSDWAIRPKSLWRYEHLQRALKHARLI